LDEGASIGRNLRDDAARHDTNDGEGRLRVLEIFFMRGFPLLPILGGVAVRERRYCCISVNNNSIDEIVFSQFAAWKD
jgi:hypothetical protein